MNRPWTRAEKWLFATPLLFGVIAVGVATAPRVVQRWRGYPTEVPLPTDHLNPIALSPDGRVLMVGSQIKITTPEVLEGVLRFDARTLQPLPRLNAAKLATTAEKFARHATVTSLSLSDDGRMLACSGRPGGLSIYDLVAPRKLWSADVEDGFPAFSPDSKWLAFNPSPNEVRVVQARTGKAVTGWTLMPAPMQGVQRFSPDGRYLAAKGPRFRKDTSDQRFVNMSEPPKDFGGHIELRRTTDWKVERVLPLPVTTRIAFSPDARSVVGIGVWYGGGGYSGTIIRCFDVATGKTKWEVDTKKAGPDERGRFAQDICYSPDGRSVAVCYARPDIRLLDAETGKLSRTLRSQEGSVGSSFPEGLAFTPDGKRLFARVRKAVLAWDLE